jgi:hypothetical protein
MAAGEGVVNEESLNTFFIGISMACHEIIVSLA